MIASTFAAFVFSIKFGHQLNGLKLITIYVVGSLVMDLISIYCEIISPNYRIESFFMSLFFVFEITIFFYYISNNIKTAGIRQKLKIFFLTFFVVILALSLGHILFAKSLKAWLMAMQFLYVIVPCLIYFIELFRFYQPNLKEHPSFWVVTGILFYYSSSLPLFILGDYVFANFHEYLNILNALNYVLYAILFSLFIRAYLCKTKVQY